MEIHSKARVLSWGEKHQRKCRDRGSREAKFYEMKGIETLGNLGVGPQGHCRLAKLGTSRQEIRVTWDAEVIGLISNIS